MYVQRNGLPSTFCNQLDECRRHVCIQLVGNEDPSRLGIGRDGSVDVGNKVGFGTSRSDGRADNLASHNVEVCDQAQCPVADVLELDALHEAGPYGLCLVKRFERLHAGLLVCADHVRALSRKVRGVQVRLAERLDSCLVLFGSFQLVFGREPVLALVWPELRLAKKRSTCLGEMPSTMPLFIASRASSGGVQWDTGTPLSAGGSQASAMIEATCSGVNFGGVPLRALSASTRSTKVSRSLSVAPSASASARTCSAAAHRWRHRRTRWRSTPSSSAWCVLSRSSADIRTMRQRSANC